MHRIHFGLFLASRRGAGGWAVGISRVARQLLNLGWRRSKIFLTAPSHTREGLGSIKKHPLRKRSPILTPIKPRRLLENLLILILNKAYCCDRISTNGRDSCEIHIA